MRPLFLVAALAAALSSLGTSQAFGAPQALISEFLAANSNGLLDEDGDTSDWIEIHNPTAATINLEGWHLTDNDGNLDKWTFPSVEIAPGGFLVVFASDRFRVFRPDPFRAAASQFIRVSFFPIREEGSGGQQRFPK